MIGGLWLTPDFLGWSPASGTQKTMAYTKYCTGKKLKPNDIYLFYFPVSKTFMKLSYTVPRKISFVELLNLSVSISNWKWLLCRILKS